MYSLRRLKAFYVFETRVRCSLVDRKPFNHKGWKNVVVKLESPTGFGLNTSWGIAPRSGDVRPPLSSIEEGFNDRLKLLQFNSSLSTDKGLLDRFWSSTFGVPPRPFPQDPNFITHI